MWILALGGRGYEAGLDSYRCNSWQLKTVLTDCRDVLVSFAVGGIAKVGWILSPR
jgi:hypothetical protein